VAHDTALRLVKVAPAGSGLAWSDQAVPFQVAARLRVAPELSVYWPTA